MYSMFSVQRLGMEVANSQVNVCTVGRARTYLARTSSHNKEQIWLIAYVNFALLIQSGTH